MQQKTCPYCMQEFPRSRFHPEQAVCSSLDCQRRRRADYHRKKLANDAVYWAACQDSKKEWKKNNPSYLRRYRATAKKGYGGRNPHPPSVDDILRLLRRAKNTAAKNSAALCVTSGLVEVWWVSFSGVQPAKNTFAGYKVVVLECDPGSDK
jgi:hypothetical protein